MGEDLAKCRDALRPHLALTVSDVERSVPFYEALFGVAPEKLRPGYAKFSVAEPALNFTLNAGERGERLPEVHLAFASLEALPHRDAHPALGLRIAGRIEKELGIATEVLDRCERDRIDPVFHRDVAGAREAGDPLSE